MAEAPVDHHVIQSYSVPHHSRKAAGSAKRRAVIVGGIEGEVLMTWLTGEPTLDDVLSDPVVRTMMARDRVDAEELRGFLHDMRRAREMAAQRARAIPLNPLPLAGEGRVRVASPSCKILVEM